MPIRRRRPILVGTAREGPPTCPAPSPRQPLDGDTRGSSFPQRRQPLRPRPSPGRRLSPLIFDHSRRVFLFGALRARDLGLSPDLELLYLAALFHDAGLVTPYSDGSSGSRSTGPTTHAGSCSTRVPRRGSRVVWTAIALHTTPGIPVRMGPEIAATAYGVLTDVVGLGLDGSGPGAGGRDHRGPSARRLQDRVPAGLRRRARYRPDTTYGTVNADMLEHFVPGFRRCRHGRADRGVGVADMTGGGPPPCGPSCPRPGGRREGSGADGAALSARRRERRDRPGPRRQASRPASWTGRAPGPTVRDATVRRACPATSCRVSSSELGYGTTGLTIGQRVFGLTDWARDGSLAEYTAVEARNLAPLPADVDHVEAAALADLRADRLAGPVRPRAADRRPDRADPRRRGRCRLDRGPARPGGGRPGGGHRPRRPPRRRVGPRREPLRRPGRRTRGGSRRGGPGVRRDRRRGARAVDRTGAPRRDARHRRRATHRAARGRSGRVLRRRAGSCPARQSWPDASGPGRSAPIVGEVISLSEAPDAFAGGRRTQGKTVVRVRED